MLTNTNINNINNYEADNIDNIINEVNLYLQDNRENVHAIKQYQEAEKRVNEGMKQLQKLNVL